MYMDYTRLWKLLIEKDMTKTELAELTGMSSRVLAKLSKNETVTTDTIARICAALDCDVSDVMECVSEKTLSVYGHYKKHGMRESYSDFMDVVRFCVGEARYVVYVTKKAATKATHIHCRGNSVVWEQLYPVTIHSPASIVEHLINPTGQKGETVIVLIKGKPGIITGLDEGMFVSSRGEMKNDSQIYVMSEAAFKLFAPKKDGV